MAFYMSLFALRALLHYLLQNSLLRKHKNKCSVYIAEGMPELVVGISNKRLGYLPYPSLEGLKKRLNP